MPTEGKGTMHVYPSNQPDLPCKGAVFTHCARCTRLEGHLHKAGVLEHFELVRGSFDQGGGLRAFRARSGVVRPSRGSQSISSMFGGRLTKPGVLEHFQLVRGSFDQAGGFRAFRARSGVVRPSRGS